MSFLHVNRGGAYFRVADPDWQNPLDGRYAQERGARWNPPGSFPVVYLCASLRVARANVLKKFEGQPYGPEDLEPAGAPVLAETDVPRDAFVDIVTDDGCAAAGLPRSYPIVDGATIGWAQCQPIGLRAWETGETGIACRSAAPGMERTDEELAWFEHETRLTVSSRRSFEKWFWP